MRMHSKLLLASIMPILVLGVAEAGLAGENPYVQMALDVRAYKDPSPQCNDWYGSCADIQQVGVSGEYVDIVVVVYHYYAIGAIEYGLSWSSPELGYPDFSSFVGCSHWLIGGGDLGGWISCAQWWDCPQYAFDPPPGTSGISLGWAEFFSGGYACRFDIVPSDQGELQVMDRNMDPDPIHTTHPGFAGREPDPDDPAPCDLQLTSVPHGDAGETTWGRVKSLYR